MLTAIAAFFAKQSVKSFIGTSLEFIIEHWRAILILVLIVAALIKSHNIGFESADNYWIKENNRQVKLLNAKIARIETESAAEAKTLRTEASDLRERLRLMNASFPTIVAHDISGKVLKCDGKEVVPFLGPDFTESWNRLNKAGELK